MPTPLYWSAKMNLRRRLDGSLRGDGVDPVLVGATALLCLFGILMVYSSSALISMRAYGSPTRIVFKQLIALGIGIIAAWITASFDYRRLRNPRWIYSILGGSLLTLIVVLFLPAVRGTNRWFRFGSISFEPSEAAKIAIILFMAYILEKKRDRLNDFVYSLVPISIVLATFAVFILVQPDFGSAMAILSIAFVLLFAAGLSWGYVLGTIGAMAPVAALLVMLTPYRMNRMLAFLQPWEDPLGYGFQPIQGLIALGSGGLTGLGPGGSVQKLFFLPEPHTDFIFAVIGEEFGLIGAVCLLALYLVWCWRGMRAAINADNEFGFYLATGITAMITFQALVNLSVVLTLLPTKGVPLPFVSAGGSSLIVCLAATGLLHSVGNRH